MKTRRFVIALVALVVGACDDNPPAKDPPNPNASAAPTTTTHAPSHGMFNGP